MSDINITKFMRVTKKNYSQAKYYLKNADGVLPLAIDRFFDEMNREEVSADEGSDNKGILTTSDENRIFKEKHVVDVDETSQSLCVNSESSLQLIKKPYTLVEFKNMWKSEFEDLRRDSHIFRCSHTELWY